MSPPQSASSPSLKPHRGVLILVFGILGLVVCFPFGVAAWILGSGDLREMNAGRMDSSGQGLTQAGYVIGIIATILAAIAILVAMVIILFGLLGIVFG